MEQKQLIRILKRIKAKVEDNANLTAIILIEGLIESIESNGGDRVVAENEKQREECDHEPKDWDRKYTHCVKCGISMQTHP